MELTTLADYRVIMLCPLSPRRTIDPISPFGRSLAQSLDSEGLTTLQVEWSDDVVAVCAARDIERLARLQEEVWSKKEGGGNLLLLQQFFGVVERINRDSSLFINIDRGDEGWSLPRGLLAAASSERIPAIAAFYVLVYITFNMNMTY